MARSLRKTLSIAGLAAVALGLAACTNRPISMMDTFWFNGTHPYLVQTAPASQETSGPEY